MNLRQIRYFVVVAQEKNFTRAAEILHISQPPLSRQIQLLEETLGLRLFVRSSRPLRLTEAGKVFYEQALQILNRVEQMKRATQQVGKNERHNFSIGFVPSMLYGALPLMVKRLRLLYPDLSIQLVEILSAQQTEALRTGRIDVGFGRLRLSYPDTSRLILREERLMLVVPNDHPLAGPESSPLALSALEKESLILYPKENRPNFTDSVLSMLQDRNFLPKEIQEVSQLQTALGLVAADMGVSIVPVSARGLRKDLCYRLLGDESLTIPVVLNYRANDYTEIIESLLDLLAVIYEEEHSWIDYSTHLLTRDKKTQCFL